jgi:hypothetical protein
MFEAQIFSFRKVVFRTECNKSFYSPASVTTSGKYRFSSYKENISAKNLLIFSHEMHKLYLKIVEYLTTLFQLYWLCSVLKVVNTFGE